MVEAGEIGERPIWRGMRRWGTAKGTSQYFCSPTLATRAECSEPSSPYGLFSMRFHTVLSALISSSLYAWVVAAGSTKTSKSESSVKMGSLRLVNDASTGKSDARCAATYRYSSSHRIFMRVRCVSVGCASLGESAIPRMSPNGSDHSTSVHSRFSTSPSIVRGDESAASRRATYCRGASFQCGANGESTDGFVVGCSALGRRDDDEEATATLSISPMHKWRSC